MMLTAIFSDLRSFVDARFGAAPQAAAAAAAFGAEQTEEREDDPPSAKPSPPRGVYRNDDPANGPYARVRFRSGDIDVPENIYRDVGIEPEFRSLPMREDYVDRP